MWHIFTGLLVIVSLCSILYVQCRAWLAVLVLSGCVSLYILSYNPSSLIWKMSMGIWFLGWIPFLIPSLRRRVLTPGLLRRAQQRAPKLSAAERQILASGDVQWERQLFSGDPDWSQLDAVSIQLNAAELTFLEQKVVSLCHLLDQSQGDGLEDDLPEVVWEYLKVHRFWGLTIPREYGGYGFSAAAHAAIITRLASRSYSLAITVMVPNSVGPAELIQHYGTEQQKNDYLPRLARSEEVPCFALTSEVAGSDAHSITDYGVVCYSEFQGETVLGIRLNWYKRYITLAPIATLMALAFKLLDPSHLLGESEQVGLTLALVPTHLPGIRVGRRHRPMYLAFMNGFIQGNDVFIPLDWVVGGRRGCGRGWEMILARFAVGRGISLPALCSGSAQCCLLGTSAYALARQQFRQSIGQFEGVQAKLAEIAGYSYLILATQHMLTHLIDAGKQPAVASAIAKYQLTELNRLLVNAAMDVHAGRGIQGGPRNYLLDLYFSAPINITVEGANILTHSLIILGQSLVGAHPYLAQELAAMQQPDKNLQRDTFDAVIWQHLYHMASQGVRVLWQGITRGRWIKVNIVIGEPNWQRQLTRMSNAFAWVVDITLLLVSKELKTRELLSARLADILSYLYLASAVLSFFKAHQQDPTEQPLVEWCIKYCLAQIQKAFHELLINYPNIYLGKMLRHVIFAEGWAYSAPSDHLTLTIAQQLLKNPPWRQRLTHYCYLHSGSALHRVEIAMQSILHAAPIFAKLKQHLPEFEITYTLNESTERCLSQARQLHLLTSEQEAELRTVYQLCQEAMQVDAFLKEMMIEG